MVLRFHRFCQNVPWKTLMDLFIYILICGWDAALHWIDIMLYSVTATEKCNMNSTISLQNIGDKKVISSKSHFPEFNNLKINSCSWNTLIFRFFFQKNFPSKWAFSQGRLHSLSSKSKLIKILMFSEQHHRIIQAAKDVRRSLGEPPGEGGSALRTAQVVQSFIHWGAENFLGWKTEQ